jgi:hypothetical protein
MYLIEKQTVHSRKLQVQSLIRLVDNKQVARYLSGNNMIRKRATLMVALFLIKDRRKQYIQPEAACFPAVLPKTIELVTAQLPRRLAP